MACYVAKRFADSGPVMRGRSEMRASVASRARKRRAIRERFKCGKQDVAHDFAQRLNIESGSSHRGHGSQDDRTLEAKGRSFQERSRRAGSQRSSGKHFGVVLHV